MAPTRKLVRPWQVAKVGLGLLSGADLRRTVCISISKLVDLLDDLNNVCNGWFYGAQAWEARWRHQLEHPDTPP